MLLQVSSSVSLSDKRAPERGFFLKRMMGLEPTTFCMAKDAQQEDSSSQGASNPHAYVTSRGGVLPLDATNGHGNPPRNLPNVPTPRGGRWHSVCPCGPKCVSAHSGQKMKRLQPVIGRTLGTVECSPAPRPLIGVALESCAWMPFRGHEHTFSYRDAYDLPAAMTDDDLEHRGDHPASPAGGG